MTKVLNPLSTRKYVTLVVVATPYAVAFAFSEYVLRPSRHLRRRRRVEEMSVAALNKEFMQSVCFALKSAPVGEGTGEEGTDMPSMLGTELLEDVASVFSGTKDFAQEVFELLMSSMRELDTHLVFWTTRQRELNSRQQMLFLLFRRGPISFVKDVLSLFGLRLNREIAKGTSSDVLSKRVLTLHIMKRGIAEAIAATHRSACKLHRVRESTNHGMPGSAAAAATKHQTTTGNYNAASFLLHPMDPLLAAAGDTDILSELPVRALDAAFDALVDLHVVVHAVLELSQYSEKLSSTAAAAVKMDPDLLQLQRAAAGVTQRLAAGTDTTGLPEKASLFLNSSTTDTRSSSSTSLSTLSEMTMCQGKVEAAKSILSSMRAKMNVNVRYVWGGKYDGAAVMLKAPKWARKMTPHEETWVRNTIQALVIWKATRFVIMHSPISGSKDFEKWGAAGLASMRDAIGEHIVTPFMALRKKLFSRSNVQSGDVTPEKAQLELDTLESMITYFNKKNGKTTDASTSTDANGGAGGMRTVMQSYEQDIQRPIRGVLSGRLLNEMLIQVQQMKAESSFLLFEIDKILTTNELTIAIMAAVPAILLLYSVLRFVWRMLTPNPPDPTLETAETRTAAIRLRTQLLAATSNRGISRRGTSNYTNGMSNGGSGMDGGLSSQSVDSAESVGLALYGMSLVAAEVDRVYYSGSRAFMKVSDGGELEALKQTMMTFYGPITNAERLRVVDSIMNSFLVFR